MRGYATILGLALALAGAASAAENPQPQARPHPAMARPTPGPRAGCLDQSHLSAEPTAYIPASDMMPPRCGRLLSTDTLISARHWNQT